MPQTVRIRKFLVMTTLLVGISALAGCGGRSTPTVVPDQDADTFLFTQGSQALERGRWLTAREYLRRLVDTYPTSRHRQDAKLGIGDSYLGERRIESDILAVGEFREFLRFYPLAARADYAQYRLALAQVRQVLGPERDQTATHEALRELRVFTANYPTSPHMAEVLKLERETRDRLSQSELLVGRHYVRSRWYPGAVTRLEALLKVDPEFTRRDGVYFYLAEAYNRQDKKTEARAYYQKVLEEFRVSEYLEDARKRLEALGPPTEATPTPATDSVPSAPSAAAPAAPPTGPAPAQAPPPTTR